eukprot:403348561
MPSQKQFSVEDIFQTLWTSFDNFYIEIISDNQKLIKEQLKKHKSLLEADSIKKNLQYIIQLLKDEDEQNRQMKTIGECLEYLLRNKVIEALCAYAIMDKPRGFFKIALSTLTQIINNVQSTSILSQSSVHPGVNQLLRCIYRNIKSWKLKENGKLDMEWINEQEPYLFDSTSEIFDFIDVIANKVTEQSYLIKVFFSQTANVDDDTQERVCFPFQILVLYFKNQRKFLSHSEKVLLRQVLIKCINCMSKDQTFADYISNESEFIDIFMQILASQLENLPHTVHYSPKEGFNLIEQLENQYNKLIVEQFREFTETIHFFKDILQSIHSENQDHQHNNQIQEQDEKIISDVLSQVENKHELKVKESFQISFFTMILCNILQPLLLDELKIDKARTQLQYLIEILVILNDKSISRLIYAFFSNKIYALRNQYQYYTQDYIKDYEFMREVEIYQATCKNQTDPDNSSITEKQISVFEEEVSIDYENNNKKKSKGNQQTDVKLNIQSQHSQNQKSLSRNNQKREQISHRKNQSSVSKRNQYKEINRRTQSGTFNINQTPRQGRDDVRRQHSGAQFSQDPMSQLRFDRIDLLLQEAQDIEDFKSDFEGSTSLQNQNFKFNSKLDVALKNYQGEDVMRYTRINMKRDNEGINIAYLQMIHVVIRIHGLKQFYREFMRRDFRIIESPNYEVQEMLEQVKDTIQNLNCQDYQRVTEIVDEIGTFDMETMAQIGDYQVESYNEIILLISTLLENFFHNKSSENIIIVDMILSLIDDSENMLLEADTFALVSLFLQNKPGSFIYILEQLKVQISQYENDENVKVIKKTILRGFEIVQDEFQRTKSNDYYVNTAENIIIFESLYKQFQLFLVHHYSAFNIVASFHQQKQIDRQILNNNQCYDPDDFFLQADIPML